MLAWAIAGVLVGIVMGLTGAGGAIVSVPIFIHSLGVDIHHATFYSLIAVCSGSAFNLFFQKKNTHFKLGLLLAIWAFSGAVLFTPIKSVSPPWVITLLFIVICSTSLLNLWHPRFLKPPPQKDDRKRIYESISYTPKTILNIALLGILLGGSITMTGLAGGVVLVPLLAGAFRLGFNDAVATSLLTTTLSSIASFSIQIYRFPEYGDSLALSAVLALFAMTLVAAYLVRTFLQKASKKWVNQTRKWCLTGVIAISIVSLLA